MQLPIPNLSDAVIRQKSTAQSYERGQEYYLSGAVFGLIRRGDQIAAQVEGSQYEPYTVSIDLDQGGIIDATCGCPYDWGGWCKHIVATLLVCLHKPERIEVRPSVEDLLADLDRDQLYSVLLRLAEVDASLIEPIEREVASVKSGPAAPSRQASIDQASIRRQVYSILHSLDRMRRSDAYWQVGRVIDRLRQMLMRVQEWVDAGDTASALTFLEAITEAYVEDWVILDDSDGDPSGFFGDLGEAWENPALAASLSTAERIEWAQKLACWGEQISEYELGGSFELAQMAMETGDNE